MRFLEAGFDKSALSKIDLNGVVLDAYDLACEADPRLETVEMRPLPSSAHVIAMARPGWARDGDSPKHKVFLRSGSPQTTLNFLRDYAQREPTSLPLIAERLGVGPDSVTLPLFHAFFVLHELGHASVFHDYEAEPRALTSRTIRERQSLPYNYASPSEIAAVDSLVRGKIEANWPYIRDTAGVDAIDELVKAQAIAYRNMPLERDADYFGRDILQANPLFMDMLLDASGVDLARH